MKIFYSTLLKVLIFIVFVFFSQKINATHNRAGEITYKQISGYSYEFTIVTYTYSLSLADRDSLEVSWGDNTSSYAGRTVKVLLPDNYNKNIYKAIHTFSGPDIYEIVVQDPNRNFGVENIPNSVFVVFALKTTLMINQATGNNNTPVLYNPPIDKAALHRKFIHNPAADDIDGDSLSYKMAVCLGENGEEITDFTLPSHSNSFTVNAITGDLIWDTPIEIGIYNVAMAIEEWRNGIKIGEIIRDMQIEVDSTENSPPEIAEIEEICVIAGDTAKIIITANDIDFDKIELSVVSGIFQYTDSSNISFVQTVNEDGFAQAVFSWKTDCSDIRKQPYQIVFKAKDDYPQYSLVDITQAYIQIIASGPDTILTDANNNSILLEWPVGNCEQICAYEIYRKISPSGFEPGICETGIPANSGFEKIAYVEGRNNNTYLDNNNETGLSQGYTYCYRIISCFPDESVSQSSPEVCTELKRGIPAITNVSIRNTDFTNGSTLLTWIMPKVYDSIPGDYVYKIYRSEGLWGESLEFVALNTGLNDTVYLDTMLNTSELSYSYKVELYRNDSLIGNPQIASSTFLNIESFDNKLKLEFQKNTPWLDSVFVIYRQNKQLNYDSIGITDSLVYYDFNLRNDSTYCYKILGIGKYNLDGFPKPLLNYSQINCEEPTDTFPPCQPNLDVVSDCENAVNILNWSVSDLDCFEDIVRYVVLYSPNTIENFDSIAGIDDKNNLTFKHVFDPEIDLSLAACYAILAVDSFGNKIAESELVRVCVDNCNLFELPNVFTPNGDGHNDILLSKHYLIEKLEIQFFNRWGILVFETDDPDVKWDGTLYGNGSHVTEGVYYYVCDVYERRLSGIEHRTLTGFVHILTGKDIKTTQPE